MVIDKIGTWMLEVDAVHFSDSLVGWGGSGGVSTESVAWTTECGWYGGTTKWIVSSL